jgi:hypothetical protein
MKIQLALISGSTEQRKLMEEKLSQFGTFETVYRGKSLSTNFKQLVKTKPDVVIITTGSPDTFYAEINPERFQKLTGLLPNTKILLRTELDENHPFIKDSVAHGANIMDERCDWNTIAKEIGRIAQGERLVHYESKRQDLETHLPRLSNERNV